MKVGEVKMKRKVNVIEDLDRKKTVFIHDILFKGKRAVKWDEVEKYLRQYVGDICTIDDSNEVIYIGADFQLHTYFKRSKCQSKGQCCAGIARAY